MMNEDAVKEARHSLCQFYLNLDLPVIQRETVFSVAPVELCQV